jgi:beta-galactosidase
MYYDSKEGEKLEFMSEAFSINANSDKTITQNIVVDNPKLWSISKPNLYYLEVQILANNKIIDNYSEKIGISKI